MDTNILLENGTNELEVLEFKIGNRYYGINVAKVREIIPYQAVTPVPASQPRITPSCSQRTGMCMSRPETPP